VHDASTHNKEVADATAHLLNVLIPQFAESLLYRYPFRKSSKGGDSAASSTSGGGRQSSTSDDDLIPRLLHEAGINLRYMGRIYKHLHSMGRKLQPERTEKKKLIELWQV
jgi:hypothetical protein